MTLTEEQLDKARRAIRSTCGDVTPIDSAVATMAWIPRALTAGDEALLRMGWRCALICVQFPDNGCPASEVVYVTSRLRIIAVAR